MTAIHPKEHQKRHNVQGEKTRLAIFNVAGALFAEKGYEGVSIRDISAKLGTIPSLIMHHFGNKALLYQKTLEHFLNNGEVFIQAALPLLRTDVNNRQAAANALAESVNYFFEQWHGPNRVKYLDCLLLQVINGSGAVDFQMALKWISQAEKTFESFFQRVSPTSSRQEINMQFEVFMGHVFYPAFIRGLLLAENHWEDYPTDWLLCWKKTISRGFCLGLGLPAPTFIYPEERDAPTASLPHGHGHQHKRRDGSAHGFFPGTALFPTWRKEIAAPSLL